MSPRCPVGPTAAITCRAVQAQGLPNMNPCVSVVGCLPSAVSGSLVVRGVSAWSVRSVLVVQIPDSGGFWTKSVWFRPILSIHQFTLVIWWIPPHGHTGAFGFLGGPAPSFVLAGQRVETGGLAVMWWNTEHVVEQGACVWHRGLTLARDRHIHLNQPWMVRAGTVECLWEAQVQVNNFQVMEEAQVIFMARPRSLGNTVGAL